MTIILDKTHTENCFLALAEEVLHAEDPTCVVRDGAKCFGVTIGNLPPPRFWTLPHTAWDSGNPGNNHWFVHYCLTSWNTQNLLAFK
jgi:hypothetical protein